MSYHKTRPDAVRPDPTQPASTIMHNGRIASPHAEVEGKPLLGGIQNAVVEGVARTPDEEKKKVQDYHKVREEVKKSQGEYFDPKTREPKAQVVDFGPDPRGDALDVAAKPEEVKQTVEAEKKVEKKPDANPVGLKTEEKK